MKKTLSIIAILGLAMYGWTSAFAATSDTVAVSATVGAGTNSVEITEASIAFGSLTPTVSDHRFHAGPMTVSYFAANSPWTIRAYTDNSPGADTDEGAQAGLVGADGTTFEPLKLWNANYGPATPPTVPPDEELDLYWLDDPNTPTPNDSVWARIPEKDEHTSNPFTWRRLAYTGAEMPATFANYLGVDAEGLKAQAYSTTVTVEIINQ